ncbi:myocardin-related transcription factor B isoform X2 [Callorhinchus milii]|uniref:myocardin-related transcription factor B isoform X2 n=1 Tax=Callorhinchus milii TaxID=7868 RepID=UPI0004573E67|nr:myocardin-related transcription factor B isoform X2 [Callorhinchus milii]|eukprot:gi/632952497/ref/XP_007891883.1/ PREDICTED: MKL/myocardin-like protein 2 isoform X2 [Callorhinchus milii]
MALLASDVSIVFRSKFKSVLQLRLQQRRTREQLVDQGIMPPLKSPAAFHEQRKSLERAKTEDYLKHKIRSRPDRSELVRMHILEETLAEPSLQATQMKLKRARLADDLNEKIAQRPGPMELVEKNILPVDSSLKEAIKVGQVQFSDPSDRFSFDEDSSDALSPEQPGSQESQSSAPSPGEMKASESSSCSSSPIPNTIIQYHPQPMPDFLKPAPLPDQQTTRSAGNTQFMSTSTSSKPTPTLIKQSQPKSANDKNRSKKSKDTKPRVKQLKYHQYVPPDKKHEKAEPPMDTNYARLLQQQQLFLQLQILSQQQQHYNYPAILPAPPKSCTNNQTLNSPSMSSALGTNSTGTLSSSAGVTRHNSNFPCRKLAVLPSNVDDLKVAELKMELKFRGLPVSGTKTDLIERLKVFHDTINLGVNTAVVKVSSSSVRNHTTVTFPIANFSGVMTNTETAANGVQPFESLNSPSPISPTPSEQSSLSTDDSNLTDMFTELVTVMSPSQLTMHPSPVKLAVNEDSKGINMATSNLAHQGAILSGVDVNSAEKDRKLQDKERQIEDLKRKLENEQRLVEELKIQLEIEKRCQQQQQQSADQKHLNSVIKEETSLSSCPVSRQFVTASNQGFGSTNIANVGMTGQTSMKQIPLIVKEEVPPTAAKQHNTTSQLYSSPSRQTQDKVIAQGQPHTLLTTQTKPQLLLPFPIQTQNTNTCSNSKQLQAVNITLQSQSQIQTPASVPAPALVQPSAPQKQAQKQEAVSHHIFSHHPQNRKVFTSTSSSSAFPYQSPSTAAIQQCFMNSSTNGMLHPRINSVSSLQNGPSRSNKSGRSSSSPSQSQQQQFLVQGSVFSNSLPKTKDPPRYEEAVKQVCNLQHREESSAHSQQMDDLFDILIESGEISPIVKEEPLPATKMRAVVANISSLPVNTVLSRPPLQVQMAPLPLSLEPGNNFTICSEDQLEALLDGPLSSGANVSPLTVTQEGTEALSLIEHLQNDLLNTSSILDQHRSPMDTCDMHFTTESTCLNLDLPDTNLDNMDWLDLTMPGSSTGLTPVNSTAPSVFSTDFLDSQDLQLNWD